LRLRRRAGAAERDGVRVVARKVNSRPLSISCRTEDRIATFLSVVERAVDFSLVTATLPPIGACDIMMGKSAAIVETPRVSPEPAHFGVCGSVVSGRRQIRASSSGRRWRRNTSLPCGSGRLTPTEDVVSCTCRRKTCSAMLHSRLVVLSSSKIESWKYAWVGSSLFC
jgi:hypothetical protein